MKNVLYFLLLFTPVIVLSQDYEPMLNTYNEWQVTNCFFSCLTDSYVTDGDTLVNNTNYKILDGYHYISRTFLLREDLQNKKVFLRILNYAPDEYLLYDFSMEVGDSIDMKNPITPFPENAGYYQLDSIVPRPLFDGNDYNHFYLSPTPSNNVSSTQAIWVEGAGSLSIVTAPGGFPDINGAGHLSCSFKSSELFYSNLDSIDVCEPNFILNTPSFDRFLSKAYIMTPVNTRQGILKNVESVSLVTIFDFTGKKIQTIKNNGESNISIDFSQYNNGVYLVKITANTLHERVFRVIIH